MKINGLGLASKFMLSATLILSLGIPVYFLSTGLEDSGKLPTTMTSVQKPESMFIGDRPERGPSGVGEITGFAVGNKLSRPDANYVTEGEYRDRTDIKAYEIPGPAGASKYGRGKGYPLGDTQVGPVQQQNTIAVEPPTTGAPALTSSFNTTDFDTNATNTGGFVFIPPDSHGAAGPSHLVNVVNTTIRFHEKDGALNYDQSLKTFFVPVAPVNFTFDPKVMYDQFSNRFVVVTLEVVDDGLCVAEEDCSSRILVAVSDDSDPNGVWYMTAIDSEEGAQGAESWMDYPGFAVDEEAVYITGNIFQYSYSGAGGAYGGARLWIINKGEAGGFYAGDSAAVSFTDPYLATSGSIPATTQPAHIYGTHPDATTGTYLVSYSGLSNGSDEFVQVIRVDNPLGTPTFSQQFVVVGNIEALSASLPGAPQLGTAATLDAGDRRALDAVWRNNDLYMTASIDPVAGVDGGQATAHWWRLDTTTPGVLVSADQGSIGGEDIATGAHTFYPSIAVNEFDEVAIGYSASASSIYAGSYYTTRESGDASGSNSGSAVLRAGTDFYLRTFGGSRNRWGDYSGTALDPASGCFWIYNQHAMARGTGTAPDDGRWATAYGEVCLTVTIPCPVDETINAAVYADTVTPTIVKASNSITSTGATTVQSNVTVTFQTTAFVSIGNGFRVMDNGVFRVNMTATPCI